MIDPFSVDSEIVAAIMRERDAKIEARLRELGPGWAVGFRLKEQPYPVRESIGASASIGMEWETHEAEIIDGEIAIGFAGFHYVVLRNDGAGGERCESATRAGEV